MMESFIFLFLLISCVFAFCSVKVIPEGYIGKIKRSGMVLDDLQPGIHIVLPFFDKIKIEKERSG